MIMTIRDFLTYLHTKISAFKVRHHQVDEQTLDAWVAAFHEEIDPDTEGRKLAAAALLRQDAALAPVEPVAPPEPSQNPDPHVQSDYDFAPPVKTKVYRVEIGDGYMHVFDTNDGLVWSGMMDTDTWNWIRRSTTEPDGCF